MLFKKHTRRIATDIAGYCLLLLALLTGWLPGPGGIPLALAGLGLLSIHNKWAMDLREYLLKHGGKVVHFFFPKHPIAQWAYDIVAVALFIVAAYLGWKHAAIWQVSVAASAFFAAVFISLMNRERLETYRKRTKKTRNTQT
ncbi:MAG: PGPGW domain-containing protein [Candidatus Saccharimonadales bacterium]